jgi:uncharacterized membrane-anchored protein YhcB (DUF1043 family)
MINWYEILIALLFVISILVNVVLVRYIRENIVKVFVISEESAELFTRLDSYREHLKSVYELPTFYGDETLSSLLEHTGDMAKYFLRYEKVYSFTQPDLIEQLEQASIDLQNEHEEAEAKKEE